MKHENCWDRARVFARMLDRAIERAELYGTVARAARVQVYVGKLAVAVNEAVASVDRRAATEAEEIDVAVASAFAEAEVA